MNETTPTEESDSPRAGTYTGFVSYARRDAEYVDRLVAAAESADHRLWVDRRGIRPSVEWWKETRGAIERSDNFVAVLSPRLLGSKVCRQELEHALAIGKKLVTVSPFGVTSEDPELRQLPWNVWRERQWLTFGGDGPSESESEEFDRALRLDLEWASLHTELLVLAERWEESGRDEELRLARDDVKLFRRWLVGSDQRVEPQPTELQREYLDESEAVNRKRALRGAAVSAGVTLGMAVLSRRVWNLDASNLSRIAREGSIRSGVHELFPDLPRGAHPSFEQIGEAYRRLSPARQNWVEELAFRGGQEARWRAAGGLRRALMNAGVWKGTLGTALQVARDR